MTTPSKADKVEKFTREKAWSKELEAWRDEHAKHCPNQAAYDAEKERAERLEARLGEFRKALHEKGLHGHYTLFQEFFGEDL